ncbi:MAG TPA: hypothetical protein VNU71_13290 [Burkholderiaceae bacterium]|nr:hypothetical protein [Burkholderiaceae bacterium]
MNASTQAGGSLGRAPLTAVPSPTPEIEQEMNRLSSSIERAAGGFGALATRLHSVRVQESLDTKGSGVGPKEIEPSSPHGQFLRSMSDRIESLCENVEYHLRTVALPG